ncbi:transposase [Acidobacteriia bacterium AH_259_A11_L15]|nr:transposase [Acidobacteriia bacterium AH_259_A11_L15]
MARPKHRTKPGGTYFVTTDTWRRRALFRKAAAARIVEAKLLEYRDKGFFRIHSYVIMPDHLHLLLTPGNSTTLEKALQLIKGGSAHEIGKKLKARFPVWRAGFTEHLIRDKVDYDRHVRYIESNPVKARLTSRPADYAFCSAKGKYKLDLWPVTPGAKALVRGEPAAAGLKPRPSESSFRFRGEGRDFSPAVTKKAKRGSSP